MYTPILYCYLDSDNGYLVGDRGKEATTLGQRTSVEETTTRGQRTSVEPTSIVVPPRVTAGPLSKQCGLIIH